MRAPPISSTPLQNIPALLKFLLTLTLVIATALCPRDRAIWLTAPALFVLFTLITSRLPLLPLLKRLLFLEPFVLGVALLALFSPGTHHDRALHFAFLVARCTLSLLALILFTATTPFADLLKLFQQLRIPALLITTLALMHRYLFVLADESTRMRRARQSRTFTPRRRLHWQTLSSIIAQLFLRASDRADRIYDAMRSRGWDARD